jgi:hypothetical protein
MCPMRQVPQPEQSNIAASKGKEEGDQGSWGGGGGERGRHLILLLDRAHTPGRHLPLPPPNDHPSHTPRTSRGMPSPNNLGGDGRAERPSLRAPARQPPSDRPPPRCGAGRIRAGGCDGGCCGAASGGAAATRRPPPTAGGGGDGRLHRGSPNQDPPYPAWQHRWVGSERESWRIGWEQEAYATHGKFRNVSKHQSNMLAVPPSLLPLLRSVCKLGWHARLMHQPLTPYTGFLSAPCISFYSWR